MRDGPERHGRVSTVDLSGLQPSGWFYAPIYPSGGRRRTGFDGFIVNVEGGDELTDDPLIDLQLEVGEGFFGRSMGPRSCLHDVSLIRESAARFTLPHAIRDTAWPLRVS